MDMVEALKKKRLGVMLLLALTILSMAIGLGGCLFAGEDEEGFRGERFGERHERFGGERHEEFRGGGEHEGGRR